MNRFIIFVAVFFLVIFILCVIAEGITYGNLEVHLIKQELAGVRYTPYCLVECHLPLKFRWLGSNFILQKSELKWFKNKIVGSDLLNDIEMKYLKNNTYSVKEWVSDISCNPYDVGNGTIVDNCTYGYFVEVEKWSYGWADVPSTIPIETGKWYYVDFIGYRNAALGFHAIDIIPEIKGILLTDFAWWNNSYDNKRANDVNVSGSTTQTNFTYLLNGTNYWDAPSQSHYANCTDFEPVNNSENERLDFEIVSCDATSEIWIRTDILGDNTTTDYIYYGYSAKTYWTNVTGEAWDDMYTGVFHLTNTKFNSILGSTTDAMDISDPDYTNSGQYGEGVHVDSNDCVNLGNASTDVNWATANMSFAVEFWFRANGSATERKIWGGQAAVGSEVLWIGYTVDDYIIFLLRDSDNAAETCTQVANTTADNQFHHLVGEYVDDTGLYLYIDGIKLCEDTSMETNNIFTFDDTNVGLGCNRAGGGSEEMFLNGDIDEFRMINGTLPSGYINNSYQTSLLSLVGDEETSGLNPPLWDLNQSDTPTNYSPSYSAVFNITWTNSSASAIINTTNVNFTSNFSGSEDNYTMTLIVGDEFNGTYQYTEILPAGTFLWKSTAENNASTPIGNTTDEWYFTIGNATTEIIFNLTNATDSYNLDTTDGDWYTTGMVYSTYNETVRACGSCEGGGFDLLLNDSNIDSDNCATDLLLPSNNTTGAEPHNFTYMCLGNANYTLNRSYIEFTQYIGITDLNVTFNTSTSVAEGTPVEVYCEHPAELSATIGLFNNTSQSVANPYDFNTTGHLGESNFTCNVTSTQNYTTDNTSLLLTVVEQGSLTIHRVYDENNVSLELLFDVEIYNATFSNTSSNISTYSNNDVRGSLTIVISATSYGTRYYYADIGIDETYNMSAYLVNNTDGHSVTFSIRNFYEQTVPDSDINISRLIGANWTLIAQGISDDTGEFTFFLDPDVNYNIDVEATGYTAKDTDLIPAQTSYVIYLSGLALDIPSYWEYWSEVSAECDYVNSTRNLTCVWSDSSGHLQRIWLNVTNNTLTNSTLYCANTSTDASGEFYCIFPDPANQTFLWNLVGTFGSEETRLKLDAGSWTDTIFIAYGLTGVMAALLIILVSGLIGISLKSPAFTIILSIASTGLCMVLGLLTFGGGIMTVMIGLAAAGGIMLFKMR